MFAKSINCLVSVRIWSIILSAMAMVLLIRVSILDREEGDKIIDQILTEIFSTKHFPTLLNETIDGLCKDLNLTHHQNCNAIVSDANFSHVQFALLRVLELMQQALRGIKGISKPQVDDIATIAYHKNLDGSLCYSTFKFVFYVHIENEEPKTTSEVLYYLRSLGGSGLHEKSDVIDLFLEDYYKAPPDLRHMKESLHNDSCGGS
ncbi:unnamed protein product [Prunus armeniaca]